MKIVRIGQCAQGYALAVDKDTYYSYVFYFENKHQAELVFQILIAKFDIDVIQTIMMLAKSVRFNVDKSELL